MPHSAKLQFKNAPLRDMSALGTVSSDRARLWVRSERPGRLSVRWLPESRPMQVEEITVSIDSGNRRDITCSVLLPAGGQPLEPLSTYNYRVTHSADGRLLGEGSFETAPGDAKQISKRYAFALMSCNQPFLDDGGVNPVIHMPRFLARLLGRFPHAGEDFSDRWSSGGHIRNRDRFYKIIHCHQRRNPDQKLLFLSGVTHDAPQSVQIGSDLLIRMNKYICTTDNRLCGRVRLLKSDKKPNRNPFGGMNIGIVEIETPDPQDIPRLRYYLYSHRGEEPVCVFKSGYLRSKSA